MLCLGACGGGAKSAAVADADTLVEKDTTLLPDTMYASVEKLQWRVEVLDSTVDGTLHVLDDPYLESNSKLAFRANHLRNADFGGKVKGVPTRIVKDWVFDTDVDYTPTKLGGKTHTRFLAKGDCGGIALRKIAFHQLRVGKGIARGDRYGQSGERHAHG